MRSTVNLSSSSLLVNHLLEFVILCSCRRCQVVFRCEDRNVLRLLGPLHCCSVGSDFSGTCALAALRHRSGELNPKFRLRVASVTTTCLAVRRRRVFRGVRLHQRRVGHSVLGGVEAQERGACLQVGNAGERGRAGRRTQAVLPSELFFKAFPRSSSSNSFISNSLYSF